MIVLRHFVVMACRKDISKRRVRSLAAGEAKGRPGAKRPEAAVPTVAEHAAFDRGFAVDKVKAKAKVCARPLAGCVYVRLMLLSKHVFVSSAMLCFLYFMVSY